MSTIFYQLKINSIELDLYEVNSFVESYFLVHLFYVSSFRKIPKKENINYSESNGHLLLNHLNLDPLAIASLILVRDSFLKNFKDYVWYLNVWWFLVLFTWASK